MYKHANEAFEGRHIGPGVKETEHMLNEISANSIDALMDETIPESIRMQGELKTGPAISEEELLRELRVLADENKVYSSYIGMGYYNTHTPKVILRNIFENPGWYTQYTPYQAEISQGRLEALINYQTMLTELTALPLANSSLLDEGTAAAEAMSMLWSKSKKKHGTVFFVDQYTFPQTIDILKTRAEPIGVEIEIGNLESFSPEEKHFGMLLQYPNAKGQIINYESLVRKAQDAGIGVAVAADILSLVLLKPPGSWGVDIVLGSTQRFGVPLGFGGPHAAYLTAKEEFKRLMPGRIIGVSLDTEGEPALRMALQTREQHIKRDRATSNICTAQVLLAIMAGMYAVYHGKEGLQRIARFVNSAASALANGLNKLGYTIETTDFFDTVFIKNVSEEDRQRLKELAESQNINLNYFYSGEVGVSLDETVTRQDVLKLLNLFSELKKAGNFSEEDLSDRKQESLIADEFVRQDDFFSDYEVFGKYHSETEMLRYIKRLESKDLSLAHSMIPLGSCTMKLNATSEMIPVSWPEFANLHPFVPEDQAIGYLKLFRELEFQLCDITGFDAVSLQPNSGAQGEYSGLMVIRNYHISRNEGHRNIALIPSSAHGTNPASAVMAGMKVVVVNCDERGNIDVEDLREKAEKHSANLASLMVTYPSTHGVFEEDIKDICQIVHQHGGQVYMDGANMNAQVGLTSPGIIGADVCHLNLHKTFCIPHGGGGPGMGPIGVRKHLAPFLPGHTLVSDISLPEGNSAVSAAPWGSASILLISYAYIKMMGADGLKRATEYAILNSNYIKERLAEHYEILYTGTSGRTAHEFMIDLRPLKKSCGIEVEDIAKRLMDYGFHAPTVSFPVAGTIMIEPTESESLEELDRFCEALIQIRSEIGMIESGDWDAIDNPLKNAPHTAAMVTSDKWDHSYTRRQAAYPLAWIEHRKFWPSVARVNNSYGDRNLICTCPTPEMYAEDVEA